MISSTLLRSPLSQFNLSQGLAKRARRRSQQRWATRLRLEQLEERRNPSTLTVTSSADTGANTLRATLAAASSGDVIDFASAVRTIDLTSAGLTIATNVTIQNDLGTGSVTVDGASLFTVFTVNSGVTASLSGLTITHGLAGSNGLDGGGIRNIGTLTVSNCTIANNSNTGSGDGAGIRNYGVLTVSNCTFSGNSVGPNQRDGGGIFSGGTLTVTDSTFSNNTAGFGGGIDNDVNGKLVVSDCTFSGNTAIEGGGIDGGSHMTVSDSTISGNHSGVGDSGTGGGIHSSGGTLNGDIVAGNFNGTSPFTTADDIGGTVTSSSSDNLIGTGGSGGLTNTNGNQVGVSLANVGLATLGNYGGPTQTMILLPGSFAINTGQTETNAFDQRGVARPNGTPSDVGAVEGVLGQAPMITSANNATFTGGSASSFTVTDTGSPTPTLKESGVLPTGVTFNAATGALAGTPTSYGVFLLTFTAHNGIGADAVQNFTLTVSGIPTYATTANQRYIAQVYLDLLGRVVDPGGMNFWTNFLLQGVSATQVVLDIERCSTNEYQGDEVSHLYQTYLHRGADPNSLSTDIAFLNGGGTVEQLSAMLIGSPEYFQNRGGSSNTGFLNALYSDALNRPIDAPAQNSDLMALSQGTTTGAIGLQVVTSKEYYTDLVDSFFARFLHRAADPAGESHFVQELLGGTTDEGVIASILSSAEYISHTAGF